MDGTGNRTAVPRGGQGPVPATRWIPPPPSLAHGPHRPKQVLVMHHHLYHLCCPLCQLLLLALGEFGGLPSVQEEIRGHHCGNIPQSHLVALLPGHHFPEEFQECLGKSTEPPSNLSISLGLPTFPRTPCCVTWGHLEGDRLE